MTEQKRVTFDKIDALRRHMLLTHTQMAWLLGVSRVTYYNWKKLGHPAERNAAKTRAILKDMLRVMTEHEWPTPAIVAMDQDERLVELQKLLLAK
jgi:DNA-binding transcriptional regulator YiaG